LSEQARSQQKRCNRMRLEMAPSEPEKDNEENKRGKLYCKRDEMVASDCKRNNEPRKVDLPIQTFIIQKRVRSAGKILKEKVPDGNASQVKECGWQSVGWKPCHLVENNRKNDGCKQGLEKVPSRPENRLLKFQNKIAPKEDD
jgi:hypothetical protein